MSENNSFRDSIVFNPDMQSMLERNHNQARALQDEEQRKRHQEEADKQAKEKILKEEEQRMQREQKQYEKKMEEIRKRKIKRTIAITLAGLFAASSIGIFAKRSIDKNRIEGSRDLSNETKIHDVLEENNTSSLLDSYTFDGQNYVSTKACSRPNIVKLLDSTDLDELLNNYIKNPTKENLQMLNGKESQIAQLNFNLFKAALADELGTETSNIHILYQDGDFREGKYLTIKQGDVPILQSFAHKVIFDENSNQQEVHNTTQIPNFNQVKDLVLDAEAAKYSNAGFKIKDLIKEHKNLKKILANNNIRIRNINGEKVLCLQNIKDGQYHTIDGYYTEIEGLNTVDQAKDTIEIDGRE